MGTARSRSGRQCWWPCWGTWSFRFLRIFLRNYLPSVDHCLRFRVTDSVTRISIYQKTAAEKFSKFWRHEQSKMLLPVLWLRHRTWVAPLRRSCPLL
jgi:hypothetical protein